MQQVENAVEPTELVTPLLRLQQCPREDAQADEVHPGLTHERDVLDPDRLGPLLGVVVAAERDPAAQLLAHPVHVIGPPSIRIRTHVHDVRAHPVSYTHLTLPT